jgi:large subunit ribosomal protein L28
LTFVQAVTHHAGRGRLREVTGALPAVPQTSRERGLFRAQSIMAKRCELCGKGPVVGRNISHAHNVTPRRFEPNLQRVRALVNGGIQRLRVCTRCLRSGKVVKAA